MTAPRTPDQRTCGTLCRTEVRALLLAGATYDQVAATACVSRKTVESFARRADLMVGAHLRGKRPQNIRKERVRV